ncbi:GlsB/YeaQ/YmgE family stress response membrane protein [Pseudokineococcus basanitobsidens]|uniref:GlsB/YeaQ/YmgE family stress response membrane protein n=1 Tax=Pseudokineococcus basanitobsidens TaxID=1926649 RepID=A0ABU8RFM1_9ACTN
MIGSIISAIVVGAIVGVLARLVLPGKQKIGFLWTVGIGIVAALIGTAIAGAIGVAITPGIDWIELLIQVVLAAIGVSVVAGTRGRR